MREIPESDPIEDPDDERIGREGTYPKGKARRQEILDRAIEIFAERGDEGASLRNIAETIGVSHATLRHYFVSREHLLLEVYRTAEARRRSLEGDAGDSSVMGLMVRAAYLNRAVPGLVQLYSTLVAAALQEGHEITRNHFSERFAKARAGMTQRLVLEQEAGTVRADIDAEAIVSLIIAASDGLQVQWLLDPSVDLTHAFEQFERLLRPQP